MSWRALFNVTALIALLIFVSYVALGFYGFSKGLIAFEKAMEPLGYGMTSAVTLLFKTLSDALGRAPQ